jgi:DnaA N-terminal domain
MHVAPVLSEPSPRGACSRTATARRPRERERPGGCPVSHHIGAVSAEQKSLLRSVRRLGTESTPISGICAFALGLNVTASARTAGVGDGLQPYQLPRARRAPDRSADGRHGSLLLETRFFRAWDRRGAMSHAAIAAVLRIEGVSAGERLAAFSLASFANREHCAWPGTPVAAARAGLSRSQYFAAREGLARRGLVEVDEPGGGRGRSPIVSLLFAESGPWCAAEVNPGLVEAVLSYSRARGSARVLLATLAAVADQHGAVAELSADEIRAAAGMADSTYRRARATLLDSGELVLTAAGGGRARTNHWTIPDPRTINPEPIATARPRSAPSPGARPLVAPARAPQPASEDQPDLPVAAGETAAGERKGPGLTGVSAPPNPGQNRTVSSVKGPGLSGVSSTNPSQDRTVSVSKGPGLSGVRNRNPGQNRTVYRETPPQTPPETPPSSARAGREPQNPRIKKEPPNPPEEGSDKLVSIVEEYVTPRGRRRRRTVAVDLDEIRSRLLSPSSADHGGWRRIRADLESVVGDSMFEIWLAPLELAACDDGGGLLLACPAATRGWVTDRYAAVLERVSRSHGRSTRLASDRELQLVDALHATPSDLPLELRPHHDDQEAV